MRIIAGSAKGRKLVAPGRAKTRPTTDRVKESIFNIIQFDIEGRHVLDLFAGSGQLGIEALSRGAESAVFVDMSRQSAEAIRHNLSIAGFSDRGRAVIWDAIGFISSTKEKFDLIFLDPPYGEKPLAKTLGAIIAFDICREGGIILCENDAGVEPPEPSGNYALGRTYTYGNTLVSVYRRDGGQ